MIRLGPNDNDAEFDQCGVCSTELQDHINILPTEWRVGKRGYQRYQLANRIEDEISNRILFRDKTASKFRLNNMSNIVIRQVTYVL